MYPKRRKWRFRLRHIIEAVGKIRDYTQGLTYEQFTANSMAVDAVIRNFLVIGEAVHHIRPEVEEAHTEVPWARTRAMRNILAHGYDRV